jgi:hypothetical protein
MATAIAQPEHSGGNPEKRRRRDAGQPERLKLAGLERAKYFAPVAICVYLAGLCVALIITSAFVENMKDVIAITAAGIFGLLVSGALGAAILRVQLRELRYLTVATDSDPLANFEAVSSLAQNSGWHVTSEVPGRCLEARTSGSILSEGEIVSVKFRQSEVLVACICDPGVGFSLVGRRRCTQNREAVRLAVTGK